MFPPSLPKLEGSHVGTLGEGGAVGCAWLGATSRPKVGRGSFRRFMDRPFVSWASQSREESEGGVSSSVCLEPKPSAVGPG